MGDLTENEAFQVKAAFILSRWLLDHHWQHAQIQGLFLGIVFTREEFFRIVWAYMNVMRSRRSREDM